MLGGFFITEQYVPPTQVHITALHFTGITLWKYQLTLVYINSKKTIYFSLFHLQSRLGIQVAVL